MDNVFLPFILGVDQCMDEFTLSLSLLAVSSLEVAAGVVGLGRADVIFTMGEVALLLWLRTFTHLKIEAQPSLIVFFTLTQQELRLAVPRMLPYRTSKGGLLVLARVPFEFIGQISLFLIAAGQLFKIIRRIMSIVIYKWSIRTKRRLILMAKILNPTLTSHPLCLGL